jgi:uncharacterized membrane protein YjfL (UPF0719 family)
MEFGTVPVMNILSLVSAVLFAAVGILLFGCALVILGGLLPGNLWKQALIERNMPAAVILAAVALACGWIIAAAVH